MRLKVVVLMVAAAVSVGHGQPRPNAIAFAKVNVVDVDTGVVRPNMLVVVEGDRITRVEPYRDGSTPPAALVIQSEGRFLIPGLWDMHVHAYEEQDLSLFIANGVTGVRQMWGQKKHHDWAPRIMAGELIGPRQVIGSPIIDGPKPVWGGSVPVANPAEARAAVENVVTNGAEFIKVYSLLPRDAYFAIADKAKTLGVTFAGHVPFTISLIEASAAGQRSIEHMSDVLFAASSQEEEFRGELNAAARLDPSDSALRPIRRKQAPAVFASYDSGKADRLFETLAKNGTSVVPTLVVERSTAFLDDDTFTNDPRLKYTPKRQRQSWDPKRDFRLKNRAPEDWALQKRVFRKKVQVTGDMHRRGVQLLAGTDMGNPFCFPGFSLHDELALLVEAGLDPLDALRAATVNPARYFGRLSSSGTIETGKLADAVLLDANPLTDIRNTTKIAGVVSGGRYLDRPALDRLLNSAEEWANRPSISEVLVPIIRNGGIRAAVLEYERLKQTESSK